MDFKDKYILGEGSPFVISEVAQLFKYENGKAILIELNIPTEIMISSKPPPKYRLILERVRE
jgi:hypothetical protein